MSPQPAIPSTGILLIVVFIAILLIVLLIVYTLRAARKNAERLAGKEKPTDTSELAARAATAGGMLPSFSRGLRFLRESVTGRNYRYDVPWLMMVGPEGSGVTTVLANAAASASLVREGGRNFGVAGGLEWWFYQRGLILSPPSHTVLRRDGGSDRANWFALLQLLARRRPRRPLDSVILAISVEDLLEGADASSPRGDLALRADALRQRLSQLRRAVSMRMPVYVLVTKCDLIPGFGSFASELPHGLHGDIFGWSSPYPLEEAFSPDWVNQCCDEMNRRIVEQQMEIFVERSSLREPDGVFLFPSQFRALRDPLRQYLAQVFMETAYQESYYFRGIYFCGDAMTVAATSERQPVIAAASVTGEAVADAHEEEGLETALVPAPRATSLMPAAAHDGIHRPVFLNHLFERKIFPECRLARPMKVIDMSRNRVVLTAKILTLLFVLAAGVGTLAAYLRFSSVRRDNLDDIFQRLAADVPRSKFRKAQLKSERVSDKHARDERASRDTASVLQAMNVLSQTRLRSVFMPGSWNGVVDRQVQKALSTAFSTVALTGFRINLSLKLLNLIQRTTPPPGSQVAADGAPLTAAVPCDERIVGPTYEMAAGVPQYVAWTQYIAGLRELETNIARYDRIATVGEASTDDLKSLLKYLNLDTDWPADFDFNNPYFIQMLKESSGKQFRFKDDPEAAADENDATAFAHSLVQGFFQGWFSSRNHLAAAVNAMACTISDFPDSGGTASYQTLKETSDRIADVSADLDDPDFDWLSDGEFDLQRYPAFAQSISDIQYLQDYHLDTDVELYGKGGYRTFMDGLGQKSARLTGRVLDLDVAPVQVSSSVAALHASLNALLGQIFVAREPGTIKPLNAALPIWDRNTLLETAKLFDAYNKFDSGPLRTTPPYIRAALRRVALSRLQENALDELGQAQSSLLPGSPEDAATQSFIQSLDVLQQLQAGFDKLQSPSVARNFHNLLVDQASGLLVSLDRRLKDRNLYAVRNQNFTWWEGQKPLSLAAYDVTSADDLKAYFDRDLDQVNVLAQEADPLVRFLQQGSPTLSRDAGQARTDWSAIGQQTKLYSQKAPGNSVSLLEDFIRTGMDKIAPDSSCQDTTRDPAGRSDYFLTLRSQLRSGALDRCRILSERAYTTEIAESFHQRLEGRFPFSTTLPQSVLSEADPKALVSFYAKLDQYGKIATDSLNQSTQFGKSRDAALDFLAQMTQIRQVFAAYLAGADKDPIPSFDVMVNFRVNQGREINGNQISDWGLDVGQQSFKYRAKENTGKWRLGDPIRITFRFADDSPLIPALDNAQPGMNVRQRTVSFEYGGAWSLFRLLLAHKPAVAEFERGVDTAPHTLGFLIPTAPDRTLPQQPNNPVGGQVHVYLQLVVVPPGGKDAVYVPLPFPALAPVLTKN